MSEREEWNEQKLEKIEEMINEDPLILSGILKLLAGYVELYKKHEEKKRNNLADKAILALIGEIMTAKDDYKPHEQMKFFMTNTVIKYHFPDGIEGKGYSPCEEEFYKKYYIKTEKELEGR
jgi:hypothetical protein